MKTKHQEIYKLPNISDKKDKESFLKKYLRWINLKVVSKDKCINGIKSENSTGNFYNNQTWHTLYSRAMVAKILDFRLSESLKNALCKTFYSSKLSPESYMFHCLSQNFPEYPPDVTIMGGNYVWSSIITDQISKLDQTIFSWNL